MDTYNIKFKKLRELAVIPARAHESDAGMDLTVAQREFINMPNGKLGLKVYFGLSVELPPNTVGKIYPRSSIWKTRCRLTNNVGIIDSGYRGEICAIFDILPDDNLGDALSYHKDDKIYKIGERCAQLIVEPNYPTIIEEVDNLSDSDRGAGGFGSTGK